MFELKALRSEALPRALEKAERYRLLNEPAQAESICLDVLRIDPDNQQALVTLLLALTDQLDDGPAEYARKAREVLPRLQPEYERAYYAGIICERQAGSHLHRGAPRSGSIAYELFREAMRSYEKAEAIRPHGNDDAILRWNTCARVLMRDPRLVPMPEDTVEVLLLE
jgi:tetratricopeptide (TPR) repeat protein